MAFKHYIEQYRYAIRLISYLKEFIKFNSVAIVGCAEGGCVLAFREQGYNTIGIEIDPDRPMLQDILVKDATEGIPFADLTILRDVIEHIKDKRKLISNIKSEYAFITFPPKYSAYAGHQQNYPVWKYIPWAGLIKRFEAIETALTIKEFESLISDFRIIDRRAYLFRPAYKIRYGWPIIKMPACNLAMGLEYLIKRK